MTLAKTTLIAAALILIGSAASAQMIAINTGSLGSAADGVHTSCVEIGLPGLIGDPLDQAAGYPNYDGVGGACRTEVPFLPELNPPAGQPFTVEFWAQPYVAEQGWAGPCPVFNRLGGSGNRSGWIFFQRAEEIGWNFAMYSGNGGAIGINLTGGSAATDRPHHVVAVYDGTTAYLYHDGVLVDQGTGPYAANTGGVILGIGAYTNHNPGDNSYRGVVDELAIYGVALTADQVQAHYLAGGSNVPGEYSSLVIGDGALLYLQNNPEVVRTEAHSWSQVKSLYN
jgi:hypothetical protein